MLLSIYCQRCVQNTNMETHHKLCAKIRDCKSHTQKQTHDEKTKYNNIISSVQQIWDLCFGSENKLYL